MSTVSVTYLLQDHISGIRQMNDSCIFSLSSDMIQWLTTCLLDERHTAQNVNNSILHKMLFMTLAYIYNFQMSVPSKHFNISSVSNTL